MNEGMEWVLIQTWCIYSEQKCPIHALWEAALEGLFNVVPCPSLHAHTRLMSFPTQIISPARDYLSLVCTADME